jgi:putative acetyltransferase
VPVDIEPETSADHDAIRGVVRAAFDTHVEVADLVDMIRASPQFVPGLSLVARLDGEVVGHVMLSHAELEDDEGVRPRYYRRFGFRDCRTLGVHITLPDWAPPEAGMAYLLTAYDASLRGRLVYPPAFAAAGAGR